jgi:hypothetical protein
MVGMFSGTHLDSDLTPGPYQPSPPAHKFATPSPASGQRGSLGTDTAAASLQVLPHPREGTGRKTSVLCYRRELTTMRVPRPLFGFTVTVI